MLPTLNKNSDEIKMLAVSVIGEKHIISQIPLQDYSLAVKTEDFCIGVVCDGHGSKQHFRSNLGSKMAAEIALTKLKEFAQLYKTYDEVESFQEDKIKRLKLSIINEWHHRIVQYNKENPFTSEELEKTTPDLLKMTYNQSSPYGTTLLACLLTKDYNLLISLGDGEIVKIDKLKGAKVLNFKDKSKYVGGKTDSLCSANAFMKMYHKIEKVTFGNESAFALCTDGLSETFENAEIFVEKIQNFTKFYALEGLDVTKEELQKVFSEISRLSSAKDDISLAIVSMNLDNFKN